MIIITFFFWKGVKFSTKKPKMRSYEVCSIGTIPKMSLVLHIVIQVLSSSCFYFTGFACLLFFFQVHAILGLQVLDNKAVFFYTQCNSSSLLFTSRKSLSERDKSIKQLSTTMTKLYSNNTSLVVNSPVPLVSVLEVFMLEWVMSSIAGAQSNQSTVVLFFDPADVRSPSPRCLLRFHYRTLGRNWFPSNSLTRDSHLL